MGNNPLLYVCSFLEVSTMARAIELTDFLTQTEAGGLLGVSRKTIWQWMKAGKLQAFIIGGKHMIPRSEVERLKRERNPEGKSTSRH